MRIFPGQQLCRLQGASWPLLKYLSSSSLSSHPFPAALWFSSLVLLFVLMISDRAVCSRHSFSEFAFLDTQHKPLAVTYRNRPDPRPGSLCRWAISAGGKPTITLAIVGAIAPFQCGVIDSAILLRWLLCQPSVMADVVGALGSVAAGFLLAAWKAALL